MLLNGADKVGFLEPGIVFYSLLAGQFSDFYQRHYGVLHS